MLDLELARQAVEANIQGRYFSTNSTGEYEDSLKKAEADKNKEPWKRSVLALPSRANFNITKQENFEMLQFLAQNKELAKKYFDLNGSVPITTYLVDAGIVDAQEGTILTQLWLHGLVPLAAVPFN